MSKFQTLENYQSLCTEVYDLSKPLPPKDAYEFYKSYALKAKNGILEPMCGTGRFLIPLLKDGIEVKGFDASEFMLNTLRKKAAELNLKPDVWFQFAENLPTDVTYDLIFIPSGSFGLITDLEMAKKTLGIFHKILKKNGILLFECETPEAASNDGEGSVSSSWSKTDGTSIKMSQVDQSFKDSILKSVTKYELINVDSIVVKTEVEELAVKLYSLKEMTSLLYEAGFNNVTAMKAFDQNSGPNDNDEVIVYECLKTIETNLIG